MYCSIAQPYTGYNYVYCYIYIYIAQPLHWVYDDDKRQQVISHCPDTPEFLTPSANPYYNVPCGSQSPYGDQLLVLLESLHKHNGMI